jgi:CSLREA domain-containing protein
MKTRLIVVCSVFALLLSVSPAAVAGQRTWTGANGPSWSDAGNWGGAAPLAGDDLVFPAGALNTTNTNDLAAGTVFRSLTLSGAGYVLNGNGIGVGDGGISHSTGASVINLPLAPGADQVWAVNGGTMAITGNVMLSGSRLTLHSAGGDGTLSGVVSGNGEIVKTGGGSGVGVDWRIAGNNTFTGQVTINGGRLVVYHPNALGAADETPFNGTVVNSGGTLTIINVALGPERITVFGAGNSGNGVIQGSGATGSLSGTVVLGNAGVAMNILGWLTFKGVVTGPGRFGMGGNGTIVLENPGNNFTGGVLWGATGASSSILRLGVDNGLPPGVTLDVPADGTFNLNGFSTTINSLKGTGAVSLGAGGSLTLANPANDTFSGAIGGDGHVILSAGSITLTGVNPFTGTFTNNGGTLTLNTGSMAAAYTQSAGALYLSTNGTVGPATLNGGGLVPGGGGTGLGQTGSLVLSPSVVYTQHINSTNPGLYGHVTVNGTVHLGGAHLTLTGVGGPFPEGTAFTIIANDGVDPIAGIFDGLPEGALLQGPSSQLYRISYAGGDGNDVVLTIPGTGPVLFNVTKTSDTNDGACDGDCSLREAIISANGAVGPATINLPAGTYDLTLPGAGEDGAATGDLDITRGTVTINGSGSAETIIDGGGLDRVFHIIGITTTVVINDVTIRNGSPPAGESGGGILNGGNLTLNRVVLSGNATAASGGTGGGGGGACNACGPGRGSLTVTGGTISGNVASRGGGLFHTGADTLTVIGSTISGNTGLGDGTIVSYGDAVLVNTTVSMNTAAQKAGIVNYHGTMTLGSVTVSGNASAPGFGDGIANYDATTLRNSILAGNNGQNCGGTILSEGHNLSSDGTCGFGGPGDFNETDPLLGPLADNGGPTLTHALLPGSPAIDSGDPDQLPATDQRGVIRPQIEGPDRGAFELTPVFPEAGTTGTEVVLTGSGFGPKKGKVLIGNRALKVVSWTDRFIVGSLTKPPAPETWAVTVIPKGAGGRTLGEGFTVKAPEIDAVTVEPGPAGAAIAIDGKYFGTKKGKVTLEGKTCKVLDWTMEETTGKSVIHATVPKGFDPGTYELGVNNKVGSDAVDITID